MVRRVSSKSEPPRRIAVSRTRYPPLPRLYVGKRQKASTTTQLGQGPISLGCYHGSTSSHEKTHVRLLPRSPLRRRQLDALLLCMREDSAQPSVLRGGPAKSLVPAPRSMAWRACWRGAKKACRQARRRDDTTGTRLLVISSAVWRCVQNGQRGTHFSPVQGARGGRRRGGGGAGAGGDIPAIDQ